MKEMEGEISRDSRDIHFLYMGKFFYGLDCLEMRTWVIKLKTDTKNYYKSQAVIGVEHLRGFYFLI